MIFSSLVAIFPSAWLTVARSATTTASKVGGCSTPPPVLLHDVASGMPAARASQSVTMLSSSVAVGLATQLKQGWLSPLAIMLPRSAAGDSWAGSRAYKSGCCQCIMPGTM